MIHIDRYKDEFRKQITKGELLTPKAYIQKFEEDSSQKDFSREATQWYQNIVHFDFLSLAITKLEEIIIHSPGAVQYKFHDSKNESECVISNEDLELAYQVLVYTNQQNWNFQNPFASFYAEIQSKKVRVTLTHHSLSSDNSSRCFIRLLNSKPFSLSDFTDKEEIVSDLINKKKNILIAGATGSGKTSFINSLLGKAKQDEHLVIIEDTKELIAPHKNTSCLLASADNAKTQMKSLLSYSLRMSPERLIMGEIRGAEIETFLLALNTGHKGFLTTVHANNAQDALHRMALLFKIYSEKEIAHETILKLVCQGIDYVIFMNKKRVESIIQVFSSEQDQIYFEKCA